MVQQVPRTPMDEKLVQSSLRILVLHAQVQTVQSKEAREPTTRTKDSTRQECELVDAPVGRPPSKQDGLGSGFVQRLCQVGDRVQKGASKTKKKQGKHGSN